MEREEIKENMTLEKLAQLTQQGFLDLRSELKGDINSVKADLSEVKADLSEVKADLSEVKADLKEFKNEMAGHLDHIYGELKELREENTLGYLQYRRQEDKLDNHETRISKLEGVKK